MLHRSRTTLASVAILAAGVVAVGCSGDNGDTTSTTPALSKSQFIAKADALCKNANAAIDQAAKQAFDIEEPSSAQIQRFANRTVIPTLQRELTAIRALPVPSGDENQVKAVLDTFQQALQKLKANPSLVNASAKDDPAAKADELADQYGLFRDCE